MMKMVVEVNMIVIEIERIILETNINNQMTNIMNITEVLEDLWYIIQNNIEEQIFQIQRILADKLDRYKE